MAANKLRLGWLWLAFAAFLAINGCVQTTPHTVKIGLVAPFEGRYREIGYDVIPAARLAIREWAALNSDPRLAVELVAYDDGGDPDQAVEQAKKLAVDPDVVIVIGHWRDETTQAALPIYDEANLPVVLYSETAVTHPPGVYNLAPAQDQIEAAVTTLGEDGVPSMLDRGDDILANLEDLLDAPGSLTGNGSWGLNQFYSLSDNQADDVYFISGFAEIDDVIGWDSEQIAAFTDGFKEGNLGIPPGYFSAAAYEVTWVAIGQAVQSQGGVVNQPITSSITFDTDGRRVDAPIYLYQWQSGERALIDTSP